MSKRYTNEPMPSGDARLNPAIARERARNARFSFYLLVGFLVFSVLVGATWYLAQWARPVDSRPAAPVATKPAGIR